MSESTSGSPPFLFRRLSVGEWLDYVASYAFGSVAPSRVVVHHTYIPDIPQWRGLASMRALQRYYAGLGWRAAPHIFVGPDAIWLATPMREVGIHAGTGNSGFVGGRFWYSIGVEMVGSYDRTRPSGPVWEQTKAVVGGLARRLDIPPRRLVSIHRDYTSEKSCPGWAVSREWIWAEVEGWLASTRPPAPIAPPTIISPPPAIASLRDALRNEQFRRRGTGYNVDWSFHEVAAEQNLGAPWHGGGKLIADGAEWNYQAFARETLYNPVPVWGDVRRLSTLLGGSVPAAGLGRALLDATFQSGGLSFQPANLLHLFALSSGLGPPLGGEGELNVAGSRFVYQAFALDTLYRPFASPGDVRRLSDLDDQPTGPAAELRNALLGATYQRGGARYRPDWAFHQVAWSLRLGAPISDSYRLRFDAAEYVLQVYADEVLYNVVPRWGEVLRLTRLGASSTGASRRREGTPDPGTLSAEDPASGPQLDTPIIQVAPQSLAAGSRNRARIALLVLHDDPGPAALTIARMTEFDARRATHYYVDADGAIFQLVAEELAAWHAGMARWRGRLQNINRISIGITREAAAGSARQAAALRALVSLLRARYHLPEDAVVEARALVTRHTGGNQ
jgi:N-acetylmuramoyl-L-alanine amidase CwlA